MKTKIGCLHAHYSNIAYIQNAIVSNDLELVHFVDPGLMGRIASDKNYDLIQAQNKVIEQMEWIAKRAQGDICRSIIHGRSRRKR